MKSIFNSSILIAFLLLVAIQSPAKVKIVMPGDSITETGNTNESLKLISQTKRLSSFLPGQIWNDANGVPVNAHGGGILYHQGSYYWYGEHKVEGTLGNTAQVGVHVYSSKDLYNWNDEGIALKVSDDPKSDIAKGCVLERPKVIYNQKTKKFVLWFHLELKDQGYNMAQSFIKNLNKFE